MSNELEVNVRVEDIVHDDRIEFKEWGLEIKQGLTIKDWLDAVLNIQKFDGKIQWYLGDLAVYAESPTTGWGESKYQELIDATGYDYQTLRQYASVSRRFTNEFRESILKDVDSNLQVSFAHFRMVAPLDDNFAAYFLQKAAENAWGVARLREEIRNWRDGRNELPSGESDDTEYTPTLAQRIKAAWTSMKECAEDNEADTIRIQVVKNGHVIEEELVEL